MYVGNLPLGIKGGELQTFCHGIGTPTVVSVKIQKPQKNKIGSATSCYGFIHFRDHDAATTAYALLGNKIMKEHELNVNWSHDKGGEKQDKNQWQCKDPSCGSMNPEKKESCEKCHLPVQIKVAQRPKKTDSFSPRFSHAGPPDSAPFSSSDGGGGGDKDNKKENKKEKQKTDSHKQKASPAPPEGGGGGVNRGRGARMMERKAMLRQPAKAAADSGATGSPGDRIHRLEQALALYRASANVDHHLIKIFRLRKELRENRAKADSLRTPELVEEAKAVLAKTASFCPQGCPLLEDYQRLKKEISFYLKWKSEVDSGKDEGLAAMKEMAFNGAAKGLAKSVEKYLVDFPKEAMKSVLAAVDKSLGNILGDHNELLARCPGQEWEARELAPAAEVGGSDAGKEVANDRLADLSHAVDALKLALDLDEDEPGLPKFDSLIPEVRKSMEEENERLTKLIKGNSGAGSDLFKSVAGLKWARQRLLSLFTSYEKIYQLAVELEQRHGNDAITVAGRDEEMPTYASMQIDTRSVEEKFATLKDDEDEEKEEDDKLSEPAQFSDAEAEEDLGEIVTVGEEED